MQSVLGADCAVTAVVGEERTACNGENRNSYLAQIKLASQHYEPPRRYKRRPARSYMLLYHKRHRESLATRAGHANSVEVIT